MKRGQPDLRRRFNRLRRFDRDFDPKAWADGLLAGVDEVGVGPLAGPVVAAAVILPPQFEIIELFDSKSMSSRERTRTAALVHEQAVAIGIARVSPQRIDRTNVLRATLVAQSRALAALRVVPKAVVVDGRWAPRLPAAWDETSLQTVVKADTRSLAVAAASVVAKVIRDRIMVRLDRRYPEYGFATHKGYGTEAHRDALRRVGLSPVHRRRFCRWLDDEAMRARQTTLRLD